MDTAGEGKMADRVGFEPTEDFDILDRFQDDSVMTTPAPVLDAVSATALLYDV